MIRSWTYHLWHQTWWRHCVETFQLCYSFAKETYIYIVLRHTTINILADITMTNAISEHGKLSVHIFCVCAYIWQWSPRHISCAVPCENHSLVEWRIYCPMNQVFVGLHNTSSLTVGKPIILYSIAKHIRYFLRNWRAWRPFNNNYQTFITPCIRSTHHLSDFCSLTDPNQHLFIVTSSIHAPVASSCDTTMSGCFH